MAKDAEVESGTSSITRLAKNLPLDMVEDIEVESRTSSTTRLAENLTWDMAEDAEVGGNGDGDDNETVEKIIFQEVKRTYRVSYLPTLQR